MKDIILFGSRIVPATAVVVALAASIGCLIQVHALATRVDMMASAMTSMQRTLASAACHDCRARPVAMEARR